MTPSKRAIRGVREAGVALGRRCLKALVKSLTSWRTRAGREPTAPAAAAVGGAPERAFRHKRVLVACARWETRYIAEWLTYHRHLGFDHVYLYCNDDDPAELYEAVLPFLQGPHPFVDFLYFGLQGMQTQMYLHFLKTHAHACERFMFLDIDEFLIIRDVLLEAFLERHPHDAAILFNWAMAGNSGFATRPDGPVWTRYTRRQSALHPVTKALIRSDSLDSSGAGKTWQGGFWHDPVGILRADVPIVNVLDRDMRGYYRDFPKIAEAYVSDKGVADEILSRAFIYHVAFKSEEDLQRRVERGLGGDFQGQSKWGEIGASGAEHVRAFMGMLNAEEELGLQQAWTAILKGARACEIAAPPPGPNIAIGKAAMQSSVSEWSRAPDPAEDAAGLVNGRPCGAYQNHTAPDPLPWWQVDLGQEADLHEVRLFNRLDHPGGFVRFTLLASTDGVIWRSVFRKDDDADFGGADGRFFAWRPDGGLSTRFLRIEGTADSVISLDQVELYSR